MNAFAPPVAVEAPRLTRRRRLAIQLRRSLPSVAMTIAGSACWASIMAASAFAGLLARGWQTPGSFAIVVLLFAVGAAIAFPIGFTVARFASLGRSAETAFASAFLALSLATVGVTAALFALDYRQYYATWHDDALTVRWVFEFMFTTAGALVQFAVIGMQLYFPIGFAALFFAGIWFARTAR